MQSETPLDKTCLSFWYPILSRPVETPNGAFLIPQPRTEIIRTTLALWKLAEGYFPADERPLENPGLSPTGGVVEKTEDSKSSFTLFLRSIKEAAARIGYPCFLRTGQISHKHAWNRTCFLPSSAHVADHVASLVEFSMSVMPALDTSVWVVREMLPVTPLAVLPNYAGFPLVREVRAFVDEGKVQCAHSCWPQKAVEQGFPYKKRTGGLVSEPERDVPAHFAEIVSSACELIKDGGYDLSFIDGCFNLAGKVAVAMQPYGAFSVDILETKSGLFVTDLAEAGKSYHEPKCPNKERWKR